MKRRSWMMFVALCLCFTLILPLTTLGAKDFSDIKGHWANSYIVSLASQGYINGYPDGSFKPDRTMTRAEFTTALINCLGVTPATPATNSYSDTSSHWARKYIEEAVKRGILVPSESTSGLGPDQDILRSQAAAMLVRALQVQPSAGQLKFTDSDEVERSLYRDYIKTAYDIGIISGFPDGSFAPFREMTRAQVCTVLTKLLDKRGTTPTPPVTQPVTGSITTVAVGEDLFTLGITPLSFKTGFSEVPVTSLSVSNDALTVNGKYVYALNRTTGNPDVVVGNTRYGVSRLTVSGNKLVVYSTKRYINTFDVNGYKYNSDYVKLYVKASSDDLYLADMGIIDETTVEIKGQTYDLSKDKITIEVNKDFYDILKVQLLPGTTTPRLQSTDPVIFRGMSLNDISAIFVGTKTMDLDTIRSIYFMVDGKRYLLTEVAMDSSGSITIGNQTYDSDKVKMNIDGMNYDINHLQYLQGKFVFYCQEGTATDWILFNNDYRDYNDVTIIRGTYEYDMDTVLVVDRNLLRIGGKQYSVTEANIQCRIDNKIWDISRIEWDSRLEMVKITATEAKNSSWVGQPDDFIFYDERDRKIYQGSKDVTLYISSKWIDLGSIRISGPSTCTYSGKSYNLIGTRVRISGDDYRIAETSWSSSGVLRLYLEEY